ncbi:hypothetical protein CCM_00543 [Cordyceps militaris CM01]|uniref:WKF domain-containing protein n=1 Tax=Cordyceps militaris (strain CM01) TaxID=983644 RepID=G3J4L9_CORMM|nr:uncharacterized protein CCM_00543 [Cordyceps militaris CM01]EGX95889.1 hypothetical protein CCM_00543 [Cordyceps militaris CM01]
MSGSRDATAVTPAWKKLGLKLKHSSADEPANGTPAVGQPDRAQQQGSMQGKRKQLHTAGAASEYSSPLSVKKPRRDFSRPSTGDATPQLTRKKSVAFADTPTNKTAAPGSTTARKTPAKPHPKAAAAAAGKSGGTKGLTPKKQKQKPQTTADTKPAIEYLRHWVSSRDSWKFNKNHQSTLIRAVFDSGLPPADVGSFYDYIDDIKGGVRMRLRETALAIRLKDNTDRGAAAFPSGTVDPDGKQDIYEAALAGFLEAQQKAVGKKRTFAEMEYVTTAQDADVIIRRLVKRMRAEMVIATLSDGDESDVSTATVRAPVKSARLLVADNRTNGVAAKRRRKLRTNVDDSDSSSSDSSDDSDSDNDDASDTGSGSDTSSSDSDDSSSEDEADADEAMDDDSSSSSSSSDDDSDDEDSDDEAEVTSTKGENTSK